MRIIVVLFTAIIAMEAQAELRVASIFNDHMVLQSGISVRVWGKAHAGDSVTIEFSGQTKQTKATDDDAWVVSLDPLEARKDPAELAISSGQQRVVIHDVLVGDVWLCTGQSNMAAPLKEFDESGEEARTADCPLIRMIRVPERPAEAARDSIEANWQECSPNTASSMSAFAYFFARRLQREREVPIGIVLCAWGGSSVAAWTSPQALGATKVRELMPYDVIGWRENCRPSKLYNGMLLPIAPYTAKGFVWYQGETEGDPDQNAYAYRLLFPAMIQDWRRLWKQPDMPFYFVQLPRLINHPQWPVVREGQAEALALPNTGMMVTVDFGHERELHPKNKQAFAERMVDVVQGRARFARIESVNINGKTLVADCADAAGLKTSDGSSPRCFEIAGADGKFFPALAKISGSSVICSCDKVTSPVSLRYAFDSNPDVNVVNAAGMPLTPFRSDESAVPTSELSPKELPHKPTLAASTRAQAIIGGSDKAWHWSGDGVKQADLEAARLIRPSDSGSCQLAVANRLRPPLEKKSPVLAWQRAIEANSAAGCTVEMSAQLFRATAPYAGADLEIQLIDGDDSLLYRITAAPMRLYGWQEDQIRVLGWNLDNCTRPHAYRLSIRPDHTAQVYFDEQLKGTIRPIRSKAGANQTSSIQFGKCDPNGEFTATMESISFDTSGAFAP